MNFRTIATLALAAVLTVPAIAADDEAKGKKKKSAKGKASPAVALIKKLEPVGLTEDQIKKINELGDAAAAAVKQAREDAGITQELLEKRRAAMKEMKGSDKKGKELQAAINAKAGISEAQAAAIAKMNAPRQKFTKDVIALLTDDQKGKLPKDMQWQLKAGGKKGKAKGDKKAGDKKKKKAE